MKLGFYRSRTRREACFPPGRLALAAIVLTLSILLFAALALLPFVILPAQAATGPTTSVTITKYASDGTTVLGQRTVDYLWMQANLPVYGDGVTHYYFQGPTFDYGNMWDQNENDFISIDSRDYGAAVGTDVKDLCNLVGGASPGDTVTIHDPLGFSTTVDYGDVYNPEPEQGKLVIAWYNPTFGGYMPGYDSGMRLIFFAETTNADGKHVFGDWDMHETLAESYWHYWTAQGGTDWPSSSGLSVYHVSNIDIHTSEAAPATPTPTSTSTPTPTLTPTPTPTPTSTPTLTPTPTPTPTSTQADTPTSTATPSSSPTPTATPEETPTPTPTEAATPTETPTSEPTAIPTPTTMPTPTPTPDKNGDGIGAGVIAGIAAMTLVALAMATWLVVLLRRRRV
jgi:hypothetical protein